jgi:hypothetical protein
VGKKRSGDSDSEGEEKVARGLVSRFKPRKKSKDDLKGQETEDADETDGTDGTDGTQEEEEKEEKGESNDAPPKDDIKGKRRMTLKEEEALEEARKAAEEAERVLAEALRAMLRRAEFLGTMDTDEEDGDAMIVPME